MKEQELNNLLDKAIGTKGNLQIHSYWMNKIIKGLMDQIPIEVSQLKNDRQYTSKKDVQELINSIDLSNYVTNADIANFATTQHIENNYYHKVTIDTILYSLKNEMLDTLITFFKNEFVDLGLPSGVLWASCNLGAKKPHDYGSYFAWGETEEKSSFSFSNYKLCNGSMNTLTKYNNNSSYGTVDNLTTLELIDDAAHHFDNSCRIPTIADVEELFANTTITTSRINDHVVYILTSKLNNNSITIPASGEDNSGNHRNYYSFVWTNSIDNNDPRKSYYLSLGETLVGYIYSAYRCRGYSIRAVKDTCYTKPEIDSLITSTLNTEV